MGLRVVGAGLPRTGTKSLQLALEQLLGGRCYHMHEAFLRPEHVPRWRAALHGGTADWDVLLGDYVAAVDWPASAFWEDLAEANSAAIVILSVRDDAAQWWRSVDATILEVARLDQYPDAEEWFALFQELLRARLGQRWNDPETAIAAYDQHNEAIRRRVAAERLLEWNPRDGWRPICTALGVPVPDEPFPHVNTTADWQRDSTATAEEVRDVR
jgi:hypothetical protein